MVNLTAVCRSDRSGRALVLAATATVLGAGIGGSACAGAADEASRPVAETADTAVADTAVADTVTPDTATDVISGDTAAATGPWLFLVFERPIVEADLEWLEASDFRVDSVLGPTTLRGRLFRPDTGAGTIAADPRIESVEPLMR